MKCCPACGRDYEGSENIQVVMLREAKMEELRSALAEKEKECEEMKGLLRRIYDGYGRTGDIFVDNLQEIGFLLAPGKQVLEGDK
jgi:hypothetical protein